jgi:hypothetical protein
MAAYFNLVLDTIGPASPSILVNNGDGYTANVLVNLTIGTADSPTTGYQMKIWGDISGGPATEGLASWETYNTSKQVTLTSGDGLKTIYVRLRDDVLNESSIASDTINLQATLATVSIAGPDVPKISKIAPKNECNFSFTSDIVFVEYKVKVVSTTSAGNTAGTQIPTTGGSTNMSGTGTFAANTAITCKIKGADLETASSGDGTKIVKVFVKNQAGSWST